MHWPDVLGERSGIEREEEYARETEEAKERTNEKGSTSSSWVATTTGRNLIPCILGCLWHFEHLDGRFNEDTAIAPVDGHGDAHHEGMTPTPSPCIHIYYLHS